MFGGGISFPGNTRAQVIPNTELTFRQARGVARPVLVNFVASWPRPRDSEMGQMSTRPGVRIALLIDGARADLVSDQGDVPAPQVHEGTASIDSNGTHGFTFVTRPIPPGDHVVTLLWSPTYLSGPATMCIDARSLTIQHY